MPIPLLLFGQGRVSQCDPPPLETGRLVASRRFGVEAAREEDEEEGVPGGGIFLRSC